MQWPTAFWIYECCTASHRWCNPMYPIFSHFFLSAIRLEMHKLCARYSIAVVCCSPQRKEKTEQTKNVYVKTEFILQIECARVSRARSGFALCMHACAHISTEWSRVSTATRTRWNSCIAYILCNAHNKTYINGFAFHFVPIFLCIFFSVFVCRGIVFHKQQRSKIWQQQKNLQTFKSFQRNTPAHKRNIHRVCYTHLHWNSATAIASNKTILYTNCF